MIDKLIEAANTIGVVNPGGYFLPPMMQIAQGVRPEMPSALGESELGELKDLLDIIKAKDPVIVDKEKVTSYVASRQRIETLLESSRKLDVTHPRVLDEIAYLPRDPPEDLVEAMDGLDWIEDDQSWILTAHTIPTITLHGMIYCTDLVLCVTDSLAGLLESEAKNVEAKNYLFDTQNLTMGGIIRYRGESPGGCNFVTLDTNGAVWTNEYVRYEDAEEYLSRQ